MDVERPVGVAVLGCGSVSNCYLPHLSACPYVRLVSVGDVVPERAAEQAARFGVPRHYSGLAEMLAGEPFDLLVNLTGMQEHEAVNLQAIEAGRNVWSEKPLAGSLAGGQRVLEAARARGVRIWAAPAMTVSPQFTFMARAITEGKLGRVAAAHAHYGHTGPDWSPAFYAAGGGSLPDLAVYNLTTVTGLLGPARSVCAMTSIVTPTRAIQGYGDFTVEAEDNAMVTMDHGSGVLSHVQSGFNYFNPHGHDGSELKTATVSVVGSRGCISLIGYDWAPNAVEMATEGAPTPALYAEDAEGFVWEAGASLAAESLATGRALPITAEHALHVVEVMQAARQSQETGRHVTLQSTFRWPVIG